MMTQQEMAVMQTLWAAERSLTSKEILEQCKNVTWNKRNTHWLLNKLMDRDYLEVVGAIPGYRNQLQRLYAATITQSEYAASLLENVLPEEKELSGLVSAFVKKKPSHEMIEKIRRCLDEIEDE